MSGTSADGVDAVACEVRGRGERMTARVLAHVHRSYARVLRGRLLAIMSPAATRTESLARLDRDVGAAFAAAARAVLRRARLDPRDVAVVGSHGQTVCHLPDEGCSLQIGRADLIAAETGLPVVSDFRSADLAVGGQGAPLVPWTDWLLLRDARRSRAVLNVGGIANVTYLPAGAGPDGVRAFDTGPGNMVMDELARVLTRGRQAHDPGGRMAARGKADAALLRGWLAHPFFARRPPRSCGREEFGRGFVEDALQRPARSRLRPQDWLATALALTVESIASACERFLPRRAGRPAIDELILCGGGSRNAALRSALKRRFHPIPVRTIDEYGIPSAAKEALSFALLACARIDDVPANLPRVTGAKRPVVLGHVTRLVPHP